ncbi:HDOD domain-containing protein [Marinicellulosiphila megalodicopiae]|uniref:HDOD domain-containing protein n=1 Tax=Marinicellulosiphila megalodicopiae TaxID=2724896 RepID=UPI003BAF304B
MNITQTVRDDIISAIEKDQLTLPTLPEVSLRVRDVAEDEDACIADLVKIISTDASLTARIIRVTNSPLLRAPTEVKDLNMAISRLGMNYTANLAIGLAMEQMFQATTDIIDTRLRSIWDNTSQIATISHVIAQKVKSIPIEEITLAALVHQLGALPILTYAEEHEDLISDGITLDNLINKLHGELGEVILKKWDFSPELISLPTAYQLMDDQHDTVNYADIIKVASLIHYKDQDHPWSEIDWTTVQSFKLLNISDDRNDPSIEKILEEAQSSSGVFH